VVRIIGGELAGRAIPVRVPPGVRPTTAIVREALFGMWEARGLIEGMRLLDPFGGTGAVSIEALSRGARLAHYNDRNRRLAREVERAAAALGLAERLRVSARPMEELPLERFEVELVFLDPPWGTVDFDRLSSRLPKAQMVVVESRHEVSLGSRWVLERGRRYGDTWLGAFGPSR
jgi:16S rRNA (guanine966-N2)-methyltransferase